VAFRYRHPLSSLIKKFKYNHNLRVGLALAGGLLGKLKDGGQDLPDLILPVPLHYLRLYARGYNQALVISRVLSRELLITLDFGLVARSSNTMPMFDLTVAERRSNVAGAFRLKRPLPCTSMAIVDDVITTGSTAYELARLLKTGGARRVEVWALARAE
jgi:ComF family protein